MINSIKNAIAPRHLGLAALCILAWIYMALFRYDALGIEEGAAHALLLNWSIIHQIASPVGMYGVPDLRAIIFVPLDLHWAGSLAAAKVYTMLILFGTGLMMYRWAETTYGEEPAMIATGLLMISPIALMQTDAIGGGIYILAAFILIQILKNALDASPRELPSWFFLIVLLSALCVTIHPLGLAIPIALAWQTWRNKPASNKQRYLTLSVMAASTLFLFLRWGWHELESSPTNFLITLSDSLRGSPLVHGHDGWGIGLTITILFGVAVSIHAWRKSIDLLGLILILASIIGVFNPDHTWAFIFYATTLYLIFPVIISYNQQLNSNGILGKRGISLVTIMIIATTSMIALRDYQAVNKKELKNGIDQLIAELAIDAENPNVPFVAASQWPARTLLACRRDVLPLPPALEDQAKFTQQISGVTHITFDPQNIHQQKLARNVAAISHTFETTVLQPDGVIVKKRQ
ncbi:MAG: hypothetical protein HQM07_01925 [Zetaproteobacteria bacterium]|nr:hypothetical protein [Zetaproteobacteria bacterium]